MAKKMSSITLVHPKNMNQMTFDESLQHDIGKNSIEGRNFVIRSSLIRVHIRNYELTKS